jgi:hypothetical protein
LQNKYLENKIFLLRDPLVRRFFKKPSLVDLISKTFISGGFMKKILLFIAVVSIVSVLNFGCANAQDDEDISRASLGPADGQEEEFVLRSFPGNPSTDFFEGKKEISVDRLVGEGELRLKKNGKPGKSIHEEGSFFTTYPPTLFMTGKVILMWSIIE